MESGIGLASDFAKIVRLGLVLGIAGTMLTGCYGNNAGHVPLDWNISELRDGARSATSAQTQQQVPDSLSNTISGPLVSSGILGGLQRQADCSLTYFDFSYTSAAGNVRVAPNSIIPRYEKILHDNAGLSTAPDRFLSGCVDPSRGISSRPFLFLGLGKDGQELVAVPGTSGVVTSGLKNDGTFTVPATQATPIHSVSLVSGDLNEDGNADLVSVNSNASQSSVTVFLGKNDGGYQAGVSYALPGANAQYGVLDDLNGDGILDLLVSSDSPVFAFSIFIGNGDGTFQPPKTFAPEISGLHYDQSFIATDVNGDGNRDIVTAQGQIFLGKGDGVSYQLLRQPAFSAAYGSTTEFAPSIVAADFNHDGRMDLATDDGLTVRIYLGNGDGTFAAGPAYSTIANSGILTAADLDGDGNVDLWTGYGGNGMYSGDAYSPNVTYALMGNGDGSFQGVLGSPVAPLPASTTTTTQVAHPASGSSASVSISSPSPGTISVVTGQTSSAFTVVVTSQINTPQTVTFTCSGLPEFSQCNFPPTPVTLAAFAVSTVPITIGPSTTALVIPSRRFLHPTDWRNSQRMLVLVLLGLSLVLFRAPHRKTGWSLCACLLLVALTSLAGCSNSSSAATSNVMPPGTYAVGISVLGSSGPPASTPATLKLTVTAH